MAILNSIKQIQVELKLNFKLKYKFNLKNNALKLRYFAVRAKFFNSIKSLKYSLKNGKCTINSEKYFHQKNN